MNSSVTFATYFVAKQHFLYFSKLNTKIKQANVQTRFHCCSCSFRGRVACLIVVLHALIKTTEISGITEHIWLMTYTVNHNTTSFERKATILKSALSRGLGHTLSSMSEQMFSLAKHLGKNLQAWRIQPDSGLLWCPCMPHPRPGEGSRVDADAYHTRSTSMWRKFLNKVEDSRSIRATTQQQSVDGSETIACTSWDWWDMKMSHLTRRTVFLM